MDKYNVILDNNHFDMDLMWEIIAIKNELPQAFFDRIQNISFYYMYPYSILSKSRTDRFFIPFENIEADINKLQDNNIGLFLELENTKSVYENFKDRYTNLVLNLIRNKDMGAVVFNSELAKYIKENYPEIKVVQSEMKMNFEPEYYFDKKIIDYNSYKMFKNRLNYKSFYILAVNSFCKNSYKCIDSVCENKINFAIDKGVNCPDKITTFEGMLNSDLFVSFDEMEKLNDEGFETFFIKTNCDNRFDILETYLYYLIKPEYRHILRLRIIKNCFTGK